MPAESQPGLSPGSPGEGALIFGGDVAGSDRVPHTSLQIPFHFLCTWSSGVRSLPTAGTCISFLSADLRPVLTLTLGCQRLLCTPGWLLLSDDGHRSVNTPTITPLNRTVWLGNYIMSRALLWDPGTKHTPSLGDFTG